MVWLFFLYCFTIIYFYKVRVCFHPGMLTCLSWLIAVTAYLVLDHPLYELTPSFFPIIFFWCVFFAFGADISSVKKFKYSKNISNELQISNRFLFLLVLFILLFSVLDTVYEANHLGMGVVGLTRNLNLSNDMVLPVSLRIVLFFATILPPLCFLVLMTTPSKLKKIIVILLYLLLVVMSGSKSSVMGVFSAVVFFLSYKRKIQIRKFIFMVVTALLLIVIITLLRDKNSETDFLELLYIYFLSPLTAFDYLLQGKIVPNETPFASTVFGLVYRVLYKFGLSDVHSSGLGFVFVPLPTNVYTLLLTGYLDFGFYGMFAFSFFYGLVWGWFYSFVKEGKIFAKILYATFYFALSLQFFADFVFPYLVIFIYQIVILYLPFRKHKKKSIFTYLLRTA